MTRETGTGKYEQALTKCRHLDPIPTAVAHPCDETSLAGAFEAMPDEIVEATSLVGTEEQVAERVERFRGAGIDRLIVSPVHVERSEQQHTLERLAALAGVG